MFNAVVLGLTAAGIVVAVLEFLHMGVADSFALVTGIVTIGVVAAHELGVFPDTKEQGPAMLTALALVDLALAIAVVVLVLVQAR